MSLWVQIYCFRATRSGGGEEEGEAEGLATPRTFEPQDGAASASNPATQSPAIRQQDERLRDLVLSEEESGEAPAPVQAVQVLDAVDDMLSRYVVLKSDLNHCM